MASNREFYLLNKLIGYQQEVEIIIHELGKLCGVKVAYIDDSEIYVSEGIEKFGIDPTRTRKRNNRTEEGFVMGGMFVYTIKAKE